MQMRPTPERQYNVCPTGWACQPVRAPGVNETTVARMRDGGCPTSTSSWNTSPVKLAAAPRRVARATARTTVMALLLAFEKFTIRIGRQSRARQRSTGDLICRRASADQRCEPPAEAPIGLAGCRKTRAAVQLRTVERIAE